jgi:hypothetical protein
MDEASLSSSAAAMFFGTCIFATAAITGKALLSGDYRTIRLTMRSAGSPLDTRSLASIYALLWQSSTLGIIMMYAYICENHAPFPHAPKTYDRDEFFFMTALLFLVGLFTIRKHTSDEEDASYHVENGRSMRPNKIATVNEGSDVLNRRQTDEWKGWMQFVFLLYQYHQAEELYSPICVIVTCYVWLSGFGNMSFFYTKDDYSVVRVLQMMWRLNFLVFWLCCTQGTTYILYFVCILHSFYFLIVYVTMYLGRRLNYTRMGLRYKLGLLAGFIFCVWDLNSGAFQIIHWAFLGDKPILGAPNGSMWEWYFWSSLHHWSAFFGMLFATNLPVVNLFFRKLETEPFVKSATARILVGGFLSVALCIWATGPFLLPKQVYNQTNTFFALIPLTAYVYFRNVTHWMRNHSLELLNQIGQTTLETYLMHHHIWLSSDSKTLLTLIPGWPKMNFLVASVIYVAICRRLYKLTLSLRGMLLPNDQRACFQNLAGMLCCVVFFYALTAMLSWIGALNVVSIVCASISYGSIVYKIAEVRDKNSSAEALESHGNAKVTASSANATSSKAFSKCAPMLSGWLAILSVGFLLLEMRIHGTAKVIRVPKSCHIAVQTGEWIPVNLCRNEFRGEAYRNRGISGIGTCSPQNDVYTWGWKATQSDSLCHFSQRDSEVLLSKLNNRTVTFVGDSIIRHLYHAVCRQVGDKDAGAYNSSSGKWQDYSRRYKNTNLEFRWAPFNNLLIETLVNITQKTVTTDLVVLGGGPWDRLHRYGNESSQELLRAGVRTLTEKIKLLRSTGVPVVWVSPTTINSWALLTEEKRNHIREDQMEALRELYKRNGLHEAVSWVFSGTSFTKERAAESYDGVHYPLYVYDAGAQILANAFDWLLPEEVATDTLMQAPKIGSMSHPILGVIVLACAWIALYTKDSFMGLSYLAGLLVPSVRPSSLFNEAFTSLHARTNLVPFPATTGHRVIRSSSFNNLSREKSHSSDGEEMEGLIETFNSSSLTRM